MQVEDLMQPGPRIRFLFAALAAGTILNLGELLLNMVLLDPDWTETFARLNLPPISAYSGVVLLVINFGAGFLLTILCRLARRSLIPDPLAPLAGGLLFWALAFLYPCLWLASLDVLPVRLSAITIVWSLGESVLAAVACHHILGE